MLVSLAQGETRVAAVQEELINRDKAIRQVKFHLTRAQERIKAQSNGKRKEKSFTVGEWVSLKLRPHRQKSVVSRINLKLAARYYSPYQILERIGAVAYKLKFTEGAKVDHVFHISLLKKAVGNYQVEKELQEGMEGDFPGIFEPETILAIRQVQQGRDTVQWKGNSFVEAAWEDAVMIRSQLPDFNLEDKVAALGEGIDRTHANSGPHIGLVNNMPPGPKLWRVYSRGGKQGEKGE
jgi:hypothetical protein